MTFILDNDYQEFRDVVRQFAREQLRPRAAAVDASGTFPEESVRAVVAADLHAVGIPDAYGGQGGDALTMVVFAEEMARGCATTGQVIGGNDLFAAPLVLGGTEAQKSRYLARIAHDGALSAFALSEPEAGSDVLAMRTRATRNAGGWTLNGTKRWITNAGRADFYLVLAVTDPEAGARGISAFIVESQDAGLEIGTLEKKMGLRGSPTAELYFRDLQLPADRLVGSPGQGLNLALGMLERTRAAVGGQAVGIAQAALEIAIEYAKGRHQFGKPIADFQAIQFMLADMAMRIRAARLLAYSAAAEADARLEDHGFASVRREVLRVGHCDAGDNGRCADPGGRRLYHRLPSRAPHAGCEDHADL